MSKKSEAVLELAKEILELETKLTEANEQFARLLSEPTPAKRIVNKRVAAKRVAKKKTSSGKAPVDKIRAAKRNRTPEQRALSMVAEVKKAEKSGGLSQTDVLKAYGGATMQKDARKALKKLEKLGKLKKTTFKTETESGYSRTVPRYVTALLLQ